jgi:hypothetical protein
MDKTKFISNYISKQEGFQNNLKMDVLRITPQPPPPHTHIQLPGEKKILFMPKSKHRKLTQVSARSFIISLES